MADVISIEAPSYDSSRGGAGRDSGRASSDDTVAWALVVAGGGGERLWGPAAAVVYGMARERGGEASCHDQGGSSN